MYDFRNHGKSGKGTVPFITWAEEEAKDVIAAVDFICSHPQYQNAAIGLLSICMGQGASIRAFGRDDGLKHEPDPETRGMLLLNKAAIENLRGHRDEAIALLGELVLDGETTSSVAAMAKAVLFDMHQA